MARLQILELPEGAEDDRPPFILVIDQARAEDFYPADDGQTMWQAFTTRLVTEDPRRAIAEQTGARAVLVFEDTVDIPANDTTAYSGPGERAEPLRVNERASQAEEKLKAFMNKRYKIEEERKAELTNALGIDRLHDWGDILNAARGMRQQFEALREQAANTS